VLVTREVRSEDRAAVLRVQERAFGRADEAELVDALSAIVDPRLSLLSERGGRVVAHVLFTPVVIGESDAATAAVALGPVGVLPEEQRQGTGSALVREGLAACARAAHHVVFVLGNPVFYRRFEFVAAGPRGLRCKFDAPADAFQVVELRPNALGGRRGSVHYRPEFDGF
jgi:putative acetyltransferase